MNIATSNTVETKWGIKVLIILIIHDHFEFQISRDVKLALNVAITLQLTDQKRQEFSYKITLLL